MIAPRNLILLALFSLLSLHLSAQTSNGTWQGKTQIEGQEYQVTVIIQAIDSTANTSRWYDKKVTGTLILERGEQREFFPLKGIMYDDQSVHLFQKQAKGNSSCRWTLSLGYFQKEMLIGEIQKKHYDEVCQPGQYLKLKKVKSRA
ncbi:MAG TPA: hypothetical protein VJ953_11550 [Saprospiraceae bacterium]|nr:hypothetical protein [Saprospiraceae bacterium]